MVGILKDTFGFDDHQVCRLRDDHPNTMPTKANILAALRWLTHGASAGDELFFHYSGHGGQVKDTSGDEESGKDDTLIPCDFQHAGQIIDDELHAHIVGPLPAGVRLWVILDCCHSGTALDLPYKVQISPDGQSMHISKKKQRKRASGGIGGVPPSPAEVIMISGCKDTQTSADVQAGSMGEAKAAGAMTTAFRHCVTPSISCEELLSKMHQFLKRNQYSQVPQMSSEQFVQLDSSFVSYTAKGRTTRDLQIPPPAPSVPAVAPQSPQPMPMPGMMGAMSPMTPMHPAMSMSPMQPPPMSPMLHMQSPVSMVPAQPRPDADKFVMDARISKLEAHIAELRNQGAGGWPSMPGGGVPVGGMPVTGMPQQFVAPGNIYSGPTY
jgi:hypothetical protein